MLRTLQYVEGDTIGAPGKDENLCVPMSRRTSIPNGEMVELASQVRVQKKDKKKKNKESTNRNSDWGVSTSKNESVDRLVPTYLSKVESEITMRDSRRSLTDRRISDSASPSSDIANNIVSQIVCDPKPRVETNPYNSQV